MVRRLVLFAIFAVALGATAAHADASAACVAEAKAMLPEKERAQVARSNAAQEEVVGGPPGYFTSWIVVLEIRDGGTSHRRTFGCVYVVGRARAMERT